MAPLLGLLNRLLPFASPGTPLVQDLLHLITLCILLYFAPQIQQKLQALRAKVGIDEGFEPVPQHPLINEDIDREPGTRDEAVNLPQENEGERDNIPDDSENQNDQAFQPNAAFADGDAQPGPAQIPDIPPTRNVGAKKAKSLARKDQRRAYHEFMRSQGDAQRAKDAEGAEQREAAIAAERERRKAAEKELEARRTKEREAKKRHEEAARIQTARRTELVLSTVRGELDARRMCDLFKVARLVGDDVDEEWIEKVVRASGIIGKNGESMVMITEMGWVVRVTAEDMASVYQAAVAEGLGDELGQISYEQLGGILEGFLKRQADSSEFDSV